MKEDGNTCCYICNSMLCFYRFALKLSQPKVKIEVLHLVH